MKIIKATKINSAILPRIKDVTPIYTGGNIYIYWGEFADGTFFIADTPDWDLRIVDADPRLTKNAFGEWEADYSDWQENHLIKDIPDHDTQSFYNNMFQWILDNHPEGNYSEGDMEDLMAANNNETGSAVDRDTYLA